MEIHAFYVVTEIKNIKNLEINIFVNSEQNEK